MDGTQLGKKIESIIRSAVNSDSEGKIIIFDHKNLVNVESPEIFNELAQGLEIKELNKDCGFGFDYQFQNGDYFSVYINYPYSKGFEEKYGGQYKFVK